MRVGKHSPLLSFPRHFLPRFHSSTSVEEQPLLTKKTCIDLLKSCKWMPHFKQIQAQLFTHGHHQNIDVQHKVMAFATAEDLAYAEKIFARVERPTLFIYNVMVKAHAKSVKLQRVQLSGKTARHTLDSMKKPESSIAKRRKTAACCWMLCRKFNQNQCTV
ncbi:hypothetical protein Salat_0173100 [Sesamum alatum]|uniref:Uncharacterized protein n=1 Tax=Sesamum alatum TaxID=300844 RepID=A0AAE1YZ21_9LAMI|nr:hypothetical protein Salat_0173100 [Sesamum alatum]